MGQRQDLGDPGQHRRQRADREQRAGEEPRHDRDRGQRGRCTPPAADAVGERLGHAVHADARAARRAPTNQSDAAAPRGSRSPRSVAAPISAASCSAVTASATARLPNTSSERGDRRGEQLAPRAALAVDDHADARRTSCSAGSAGRPSPMATNAHVVDPAGRVPTASFERRRDHERRTGSGVSSGTKSSRGVRALSAKRRRASVASGDAARRRVGATRRGSWCGAMAVMGSPSRSVRRPGGEAVAGEPQVDVVEASAARC